MYRHKLRHDEIPTVPKDWKCPRGRPPNLLFSLVCWDINLHGTRQHRERKICELANDRDEWKRLST